MISSLRELYDLSVYLSSYLYMIYSSKGEQQEDCRFIAQSLKGNCPYLVLRFEFRQYIEILLRKIVFALKFEAFGWQIIDL